MAEKGFGVKEVNLIGPSGTPTITSPNNLNLNANNVAISTNVSIGGTLSVTGNVSVGGTLTYEDVTNIDSVGLITARSGVVTPNVDVDDFVTVGSNIQLGNAGVVTATTFSGSAASLTSIPAANITGTLPAISGANLTGITITPTDSDIQVAYTVTANGSSAYRFAGNGVVSTADNPDLYLIRGQKYRFINNSGGSHPFQIRESSGGTAYSTGVTNNGAASGNIDFAPTYDSPAQLVYQCTSHGGMVGNIYLRGAGGQTTNVGVTTFSGFVNVNGNFGIGNNSTPDGNLHVFNSSAGSVTADTSANLAVFESGNTNNGITILSPNSGKSNIYFGTTGTGGSYEAGIRYTHEAHGTTADRRAMDFRVGGGLRARIQSGKLLVGRTSSMTFSGDPVDHQFEQITNNGYTMGIHADQAEQRGLAIYFTPSKSANPFIGARVGTSWKFILRGDGDCENANNSYGGISDISLKENIVDANSQWNDIKNIKIRNFNFKASTGYDTHKQIGVVAQELETVCPNLVDVSTEHGMKTVASSVLYMKAVKALQEAMAKIEILEAKVAALEGS